MKGKHPKRRKDKYNPYNIFEMDHKYYITFVDGTGEARELEIPQHIFEVFNESELRDISQLHKWDKYEEHSELTEISLNKRAFLPPESVEEKVIRRILTEKMYEAIQTLPDVQRRRLVRYFFDNLTYEQIAGEEH